MATSYVDYTGDGNATKAFSFPSLTQTDVKVEVDGTIKTASTHYNITSYNSTSGGNVVFTAGNIPTSSNEIRIYRDTDISTNTGEYDPKATFTAGSSVKADDLNNNQKQVLYAIWEEKEQTITTQDLKDNIITSSKILGNAVNSAHLADNSVGSSELQSDSVGTTQIKDNAVTSAKIAGNAVGSAQIADGAVGASEIAADAVRSAQIQDGAVGSSEIAGNAVNSAHIADGAVGSSEIAADAVGAAQIADGAVGSAALAADSVGSAQIADGAVGASEIAADAVRSAQIQDGAVGSSEIAADAVGNAQLADNSVAAANIAANAVGSAQIADGAVGSSELDANSVGNVQMKDNAITMTEIGCEETTITDDDTKLPTSGAVVDYVAAQIAPIGGLEVIANEDSFPTTQPASGVVISIADAAGVVVTNDGTLKSITARRTGAGSDNVVITDFPSSLAGETLAASVGLMVSSDPASNAGGNHYYKYHKLLAAESDVKQLSDDINDFNARYRIASSAPGSNNDEGDLYFDTTANKMYVHDGSAWGQVTSTGEFKILGIKDNGQAHNGTGPTFNGSNDQYDLFESTSDASLTQAAQLIVVLNGVIQKPNDGTFSASGEGFYLDGTDGIRFCDPPPTGSTLFVTKCGSAISIAVPADNSVTAGKTDISLVQGDIIYSNGTDSWTRLAKGTAGQTLTMNSGASAPEWAATTDATKMPLAGGTFTGDVTFDNGTNSGKDMIWDESDDTLKLNDDVQISLGSDRDMRLYHTGSHAYINVVTGDLNIRTNSSESAIVCTANAGVATYYDTAKKTETTNTGLDVTGVITADGLDIDDDHIIKIGTGNDLQIRHDGSNSFIDEAGTGDLLITATAGSIQLKKNDGEKMLQANVDGSVELYYDNTKELETKSGGVKLNGHSESVITALTSASSVTIDFSLSNHFSCTMGHNITFANPTTESVGQSGTIVLTQDGTGSRTASWGSQFLWAGGTAPTLSTAANAVDRIDYFVAAADKIHCVASLDMK